MKRRLFATWSMMFGAMCLSACSDAAEPREADTAETATDSGLETVTEANETVAEDAETVSEATPETAEDSVVDTVVDTRPETISDASETSGSSHIEWRPSEPDPIGSGADVKLAFNNTTVGARLPDGTALLAWTSNGVPMVSRRAPGGGNWTSSALPRYGAAPASKVSLVHVGGGVLFAGWTEGMSANAVAIASHSADGGLTWDAARLVSATGVGAESPSATAVLREGQPASVVMAWSETATHEAHYTIWTGPSWDDNAFMPSAPLESHAGASHDVNVFARGAHVVSAWEDDGADPVVLRFAESHDGGLTWGAAHDLNGGIDGSNVGQDVSGCIDGQGRLVFGFQRQAQISLARVAADGAVSNLARLGPGLFAHTVCDDLGFSAIVWEYFTGGNAKDDTVKTVGLSLSLDDLGAIDGPHAMPDSSAAFGRVQALAVLSGDVVDVYWIETSSGTRTLMHREARIVR